MPVLSPTNTLRGIKGLFSLLCLTCAALSKKLLPDRLIPQQLSVLNTVGGLLILLCLVIALLSWSSLQKYLRTFIALSLIGILLLFSLQVFFVSTVENYGEPPATHNFLIGYKLTDYGMRLRSDLSEDPLPEAEYIRKIGYDRIPAMYGRSYYVIAMAYSTIYLVFILAVVFVIASVMSRSSANLLRRQQDDLTPNAPDNDTSS